MSYLITKMRVKFFFFFASILLCFFHAEHTLVGMSNDEMGLWSVYDGREYINFAWFASTDTFEEIII